jgi:transposase
MEGDKIILSQKQLQRIGVINLVRAGLMTLKEAANVIGLSYRQTKRIKAKFHEKGAKGLIHGNVGRSPKNHISPQVKQKVLDLSCHRYASFNDRHFWEQLIENEGLRLGRETVRKIRREAGLAPKRKRRPPRHRKRRERMAQSGAMVLWDGSPHPWLGSNQPPCCLMAALDDATGRILAARFFPFEGTEGYLWLLRHMVEHYGIPLSIYQDRHGSLQRHDEHWTLEEQLQGHQEPTQVGAALEALGIRPIFALSPQAKGRIEKLFATLQDRLGAELDGAGIQTLWEANSFLTGFLRHFNRRFAIPPQRTQPAWRPVPTNLDVNRIISFRYSATVGLDNTVRLGGLTLDIPPGPNRHSYAKAKVEARQLLNGSWRIYYQNHLIATHSATKLSEPIRALRRKKPHLKGTKNYTWIYETSAQSRLLQKRGHFPLGTKGTY